MLDHTMCLNSCLDLTMNDLFVCCQHTHTNHIRWHYITITIIYLQYIKLYAKIITIIAHGQFVQRPSTTISSLRKSYIYIKVYDKG